ncbi:MAG: 1-(5-phosphoribosyl)-5-[(5-phosphoribosylamino)methylideneamino]imidazole-4-carboxamide isomerase [Thermodesulfobacteriota bacterium]|nr:1-(5-phosphoribosyl)-5-[(5-phosphoribosylamino)methylideneamino]imidazole-4-carboxamide isomerase [Thermodesulfobacteriota bacterium]
MMVIPAVDIKGGKCVRLLQGDMNAETVFSDDPGAMAERWAEAGAELIHVVDLDGAIEKSPRNLKTISALIRRVGVPVQVGGGIREIDTVRMYADLGVARIVIGSAAVNHPDLVTAACREFPGRIVLGIDARDGRVATEGWTSTTDIAAADLAARFEGCGVAAINFTDIHRDGMRTGPNIPAIEAFARATAIPVVASGGVSTIDDIQALLGIQAFGVTGVITGRALYDGTLDLAEAIAVASAGHSTSQKSVG